MSEESSDFVRIHTLERLINILQSNDRSAKKKAFLEIKNTVNATSGVELKELYDKLVNTLRISFQDRTESCREQAVQIIYEFIKRLDEDTSYLTTLVPAVYSRICRDEDYENSEEIRYLYVKFLALLIDKYERNIAPYTGDIVDILSKLISDDAPHVKKSSCACLIKLANTTPYEFFLNTKKCIKPLSNNLTHQHWRVRVAAIEALEWTMLKGDNKYVREVVNPISRCLLDDSPFVRLAVTKLTGHWILELIDRYSFFSSLLPIILTSLTDECEDVVNEAIVLWAKAGDQYVRENENDYKNRMDFEPETLEHYPAGVKRPRLGCRILIEREVCKFVVAIGKELTEWTDVVRIKAAQLLSQVTLHAEQNITMHVDKIIGPMSKAAMDKELPDVVTNVRLAAYYMGFFVPAQVFCDLIVDYMKEANFGERRVVASIISGSKKEDLKEHLPKIASLIGGTTFKRLDQEALLEVIAAVFKTCQEDSLDIGDDIFNALVAAIGLAEAPSIAQKAYDLLQEFVQFAGGDKRETYDKYCSALLKSLKEAIWTVHCHEQFIFHGLATQTGEVIPSNLTDILEIIKDALSEKSDPEVKLKIYMSINEIIKGHEITLPDNDIKNSFASAMLNDILPLHLKWHPGKTAESIRTISCTSLYLILSTFNLSFKFPSSLIPFLQSLIDDPSEKTRVLALLCIITISDQCDLHENETFVNIITNVLKRLDDCERKVRELSVKCIQKLYEAHLTQRVHNYLNKAVLKFSYTTLLIHLDDSEKDFRERVFECLDSIGSIEPAALRENLLEQNFRDKEILKRLIASVEDKLKTAQLKETIKESTQSIISDDSDSDEDKIEREINKRSDDTSVDDELKEMEPKKLDDNLSELKLTESVQEDVLNENEEELVKSMQGLKTMETCNETNQNEKGQKDHSSVNQFELGQGDVNLH